MSISEFIQPGVYARIADSAVVLVHAYQDDSYALDDIVELFGRGRFEEDPGGLPHERPADHRQDDRDPRPDVVKGDDKGSSHQAQEAVGEGARASLAVEENEELGPHAVLKDVGQTDDQEIDHGKDLDRLLHLVTPVVTGKCQSEA